jgi:hypothetical protein
VQPQITGPVSWPARGPSPTFTIDPAGRSLFLVELAADRHLMTSVADRSPENYFYGGDAEGDFATGTRWTVPSDVWARMAEVGALFYRVVVIDQGAGDTAMSVEDDQLDALPSLEVTTAETPEATASIEPLPSAVEPIEGFRAGDFLLGTATRGFKHNMIKFGQGLRLHGAALDYVGYTHAALVTSPEGDLIEAVGEGVRATTVREYVANYDMFQVVHITASDEDRAQVVEFAEDVLEARAPYGFLANASILIWALTGSRLVFFLDGSYTCSGLVASALMRTPAKLGTNPARVMPAQLAAYFQAPLPPPDPLAPSRTRWGWFGGRRG